MSDEDYDMIVKIVLIGDSGVGKTNISSRFLKGEFNMDTKATVGVEFGSKKFEIEGYNIKAQIWDTAGQERYKSITNAYYKGAKGALLVYDVSRRSTFDSIDRWITDLRQNSDPNVNIILVGNKCDIPDDEREVLTSDGQKKAELYRIAFFETSALRDINIVEAFRIMIQGKFKRLHIELFTKFNKFVDDSEYDSERLESNVVNLTPNKDVKKKKKCC
jgi:Ras-related protein Rab-11A